MARNYAEEIGVPEDGTWSSILTLVAGISYGVVGVIQVLVSLGILPVIIGFTDLVGGLLLIIVGAVFLTGVRPLSNNEQEGYAFIAVGYILAAILFALQVMVIITNAMGWVLGYEDWLGWNILNDITPSFWMFIILMTSTGALWILGNLRNKLRPKTKEEPIK
ncbi:hypothetical protein EU527_14780 [Candidatus Thorarchaeota archaeon]|nr:MAG: hypothetical protein EU527_14780 [Candidatus Thorarchaeota archaeon]